METEEPPPPPSRPRSSKSLLLPELDTFLHLLILVRLLDSNNLEKVRRCLDGGLTLYQPSTVFAVMVFHKPLYMGFNTRHMLFRLFATVGKE